MTPITIEYPDFPEEIQIAAKRRAQHFDQGDVLPRKYLAWDMSSKDMLPTPLSPNYRWKSNTGRKQLWDMRMKQWVIKNPLSASKPRFVTIAGNDIMRMHEHTWAKIVVILKNFFIERLGKYSHTVKITEDGKTKETHIYEPLFTITKFPVNISMEIHTFPRFGNWDLSNLWIYNKCFEDAMQEAGVIPNDNIRFITQPGAPKFVPVTREEDRKMIFTINTETDGRILGHLLYQSAMMGVHKEPWSETQAQVTRPFNTFRLQTTTHGKAGDLSIESVYIKPSKTIMNVNLGKDDKFAEKGFIRVRNQCFQLNMIPEVSLFTWQSFERQLREIFLNQGIPVIVRGNEIL